MKLLLILPATLGSFDVYKRSPMTRLLRAFFSAVNINSNFFLPPLGLLTIAACTPDDVDVTIIDEKVNGPVDPNLEADLVGISIFAHSAHRGYELADQFRARNRKVVLGGYHASTEVDEALAHADAVVCGEPESLWKDLLDDFRNGQLKRVYKAERFVDLNGIPPLRFDLIDMDRYLLKTTIQATRGCPLRCDFCSVGAFFDGSFRCKPVAQVIDGIKPVRPGDLVCFVDDNITGSPQYASELFEALKPLQIRWISQASINIANNKKLLKLAADSGCICLLIGLETLETKNMGYLQGKIKLSKVEDQIASIHEHGISINGSFIFGFDGDTLDTFDRTAEFCIRNYIELPSFNVFNPIPGTMLYEQMKNEGRLKNNGYSEHEKLLFSRKPFYSLKNMTEREFYEGFDRMCRTVFSYSNMFRRNLKYRICFKEHIYTNFVWRQCDLQLGRRSFRNL